MLLFIAYVSPPEKFRQFFGNFRPVLPYFARQNGSMALWAIAAKNLTNKPVIFNHQKQT